MTSFSISGTTDYMDRFIDEQEQSHPHPSPNYHSLMYGTDGGKRGISINTPSGHHHSMLKPTEALNGSTPLNTPTSASNGSAPLSSSSSSTNATNGSSGLSVQNMIAYPENPPTSNNSSMNLSLSSTPTLAVAPNTSENHQNHHNSHHHPPTTTDWMKIQCFPCLDGWASFQCDGHNRLFNVSGQTYNYCIAYWRATI